MIEEATAEFAGGFTVVTGETGAGKTMVVSGLRLLSGHRADASRVRAGSDKAGVDGIFDISALGNNGDSAAVQELIDGLDGFVEQGEVIVSRTVSANGRSRAQLAGKTAAAAILAQFSSHVLTIHGQNDQLRLLDPARQLAALDEFAGTGQLVEQFADARKQWSTLAKDLKRRIRDKRELSLEAETLQRALDTINEIDPQPGEDVSVKEDIRKLQDADDLRSSMLNALAALDGSDGTDAMDPEASTAQDLIAQAAQHLGGRDAELQALAERLENLNAQIADVVADVGNALLAVPDPDSLESLLERQQELRDLRKFAADVDGALEWKVEAEQRLSRIDVSDEVIADLEKQVQQAHADMMRIGRKLSAERTEAAVAFGQAVTEEIRGLHMSATFSVLLDQVDPSATGLDLAEFRLSQGGHETSLASSASGGELSRIMLALEVILSTRTAAVGRTMVFDEVDAGVGGKAAVEIGRRLAALATDNQVIVVTHLPQVAAFADAHVYVSKAATDTNVSSTVSTLTDEQKVEELSRMLAGLESETGRAHAEELMQMAKDAKTKLRT